MCPSMPVPIPSLHEIKAMKPGDLLELASNIRKFIIGSVAKTGGHLGANLGVVELTIAIHYVFDSPKDSIIWDIGHQSYVHKILTGRAEQFHKLRSYNGISGFTNPQESEHDLFFAGHSSTSLGLGLGVATAKELMHDDSYTISIIGDGAISAGMAFEAINNISISNNRFITVLNDNDMSISAPTGAISKYLPKLFISHGYQGVKAISKKFLSKFPDKLLDLSSRLYKSFKGFVSGGNFFEELGYDYIGPVDGHNIEDLIDILQIIKKNAVKPVLLHVITQKGKGYAPAESARDKLHGVRPFDVETGNQPQDKSKITLSKYISSKVEEIAESDGKVTAITPAMKQGSALESFADKFPDRFYDCGIAEQHAVTFSAGQAKQGLKPYCFIYSTFLQRGYDQIIHDVALQNLPVRFIVDRAGLCGEDGPTHHGIFDVAFLRIIPNIEIINTYFTQSIDVAIEYSKYTKKPVFIRIPKDDAHENDNIRYEAGKMCIVRESSEKKLLIATGKMLAHAIKVEKYHDYTIIDPFFIKPLDSAILDYIKRNELIEILDENSTGSLGSIILEECHRENIETGNVKINVVPDKFISHGNNSFLIREIFGI